MSTRKAWSAVALLLVLVPVTLVSRTWGQNTAQPSDVQVETDVPYGEADGQKLLLDIYRPATNGENRPAVMLVHGGGWSGGNKRDFADWGKGLAKAGYVAFCVGYRLVTKEGDKIRNQYPAQIDDVQRAVRWIRANAAKYGINPNRLGAAGASAGGHLVSLLGTMDTRDNSDRTLSAYSSRVNCVIDIFGPADLTSSLPKLPDLDVDTLLTNLLGKSRQEAPEVYRAASPVFHIDRKTVPFLIVHGTEDKLVPVAQSRRFHEALQKAGIESKLIVFEGEGHGFQKKENFETFATEAFVFLERHLKTAMPQLKR